MDYSDSRDIRHDSAAPAAARRADRGRLRRERRLRLIPLVLGLALVALLSGLFTAQFGAASPASGATPTTAPNHAALAPLAQPAVDPVARAKSVQANEMGQVLVLMYHLIGHDNSQYNRTPEGFRQDIADLKAAGYYPVNLSELVRGDFDVPEGKTPVVITFDDSSGGQYRINAEGSLDPDCAVAIMQEAVRLGGWASRASFYPLIDVDAPDHVLFGQPDLATQKLQKLVAWGYEVGSHTVSHLNLKKASPSEVKKQLYNSKTMLEEMIGGGYVVTSLAAPFGEYPKQASILKAGEYGGRPYEYQAALKAMGGPAPSPFSDTFRAYHIPRVQIGEAGLAETLALFESSPELRYVSDGDPDTVSVPQSLDASLGAVRTGLGQEVVRY
ncbi:MAG: polysaccharide deacetylase family protein [Thermoleophilia bacterium]|nr:polysaccharide deacetylase family protein [Thermoleophilia bacterium]